MNEQAQQNETSLANVRVFPDAWIERLFNRLSALYGSKFADLWRGTDLENVKRTWAEKLGGFADRPEIIRYALDACDDRPWPPTLPEFIGLCRDQARRIGGETPSLPAPQLSIEERMDRARQLESAAVKAKDYDYRGWCKELKRRYLNGDDLLPIQISMASEVMGEVWEKRECKPRAAA